MVVQTKRPYLVLSKLIEQPTWGGTYIVNYKNITDPELKQKKFGQSYELYGKSVFSLATDTADTQFTQSLVDYNKSGSLPAPEDYISLESLISADPKGVLGPSVNSLSMPLLLKFTQALGNSFQIHVRKKDQNNRWKPKPESWYYLEDGIVTFGIKKGADLSTYKAVCVAIDQKTTELSSRVMQNTLSHKEAVEQLKEFIKSQNPWKFVNVHKVKKHTIVDLSAGGIHHSWEEDPVSCPGGNILYEVQLDVTDDESTIRSFDKGKMQKDGTVRTIHIDDYFTYLDTQPENNDLTLATQKRSGQSLFQTPYYSLDTINLTKEVVSENTTSFVHLFVVEGEVEVETADHTIEVGKGHSCFIPFGVRSYSLTPLQPTTSVLKTYIK